MIHIFEYLDCYKVVCADKDLFMEETLKKTTASLLIPEGPYPYEIIVGRVTVFQSPKGATVINRIHRNEKCM